MSECGVCIGGEGDGEYSEFHRTEFPKARKSHKCCECNREIHPGEKYEYVVGKFDGDLYKAKTCDHCAEIRRCLSCDMTPAYGTMWSEIMDYVFPHINTACFDRLETTGAKTYLQLNWMQWKGITK